MAVQADVKAETLEPGYQITSTSTSPSVVTVLSSTSGLVNVGEFLTTTPISLTGVYSELTTRMPLIVPAGVAVFNDQEERILKK